MLSSFKKNAIKNVLGFYITALKITQSTLIACFTPELNTLAKLLEAHELLSLGFWLADTASSRRPANQWQPLET